MKLRATRNAAKRKSYVELQRIGSSDDEDVPVQADDQSDDDVALDVDAEAEEEDEDEDEQLMEDATSEDDGSVDEDEEVEEDELDGGIEHAPGPAKARKRRAAGEVLQNYHEAPLYPQDPRFFNRTWKGTLKRYAKYRPLRDTMYGPEFSRIKIIWELDTRWTKYPLLPPKYPPGHENGIMPSPWVPANHEIELEKSAVLWYHENQDETWGLQRSHPPQKHIGPRLVPRAEGDLVAFLGPWSKQEEFKLAQGTPNFLSQSGRPEIDPEPEAPGPAGWMVDVGGLVLAMEWQPKSIGDEQLLAIATVPHSDQEHLAPDDPRQDDPRDAGAIQFWEVVGTRSEGGLASPYQNVPRLVGARCFNWGRPKRLKWCPVPLNLAGIAGRLALLSGDGKARVFDVTVLPRNAEPSYEWMDSPIATLNFDDEDGVAVTCFTWINANSITLGHSDGSISVWSVQPNTLIQRHYPHSTSILDMCSGYPSNPNLVCTVPVGGSLTLTDLDQASSEMTFFAIPVINFQPNVVTWNEIMQGFIVQYGANHGSTSMAFLHVRFFCQARNMITCSSSVMCVSSGATHPYVLTGCADGSLWCFNALAKLFSQKYEKTLKIKILEHEYRRIEPEKPRCYPAFNGPRDGGVGVAPPLRGAVRILQGYVAEENNDPQQEARKETDKQKKRSAKADSKPKRGRPKKQTDAAEEEDEGEPLDPIISRHIIHEPLTRVTTVAWNPNLEFSCWAACSFGSGLVRVMDLGVE